MITGVIGLTLWTDDLETMFHFYKDVMGLPLHARHDDFIAFEFGGFREFRFNWAYMGTWRGNPATHTELWPISAWTIFEALTSG